MCGICGVWEYGASEGRVESSLVERMRDQMTHRGPDDSGKLLFDDGRGGLGFRRLSIIDLTAAGHQPMHGCNERTWLVFNGEIYNHASLREGLEQRGHVYTSRTDSETILHLYEECGLDFVKEIEGDFAIALWDADREQLVLARDRAGVKPLYFYHQGGRFIFASEIKAILQHPAVTPDVNEEALQHYLTFITTPAPQTLFCGIQKLPAGHILTINRSGDITMQQYWDPLPPALPAAPRSQQEHQSKIVELLRGSIKKRMMADVPVGVFLSGGVDSSAIVAVMSELTSRAVRTFTIGFRDDKELNELDSARAISNRFGTNHHEVMIGGEEMMSFLPELIFHQDEPIADPVCVPLYFVSKLARDTGTIVVQVGEGSDELFGGYDWFRRYMQIERFWRHGERAPDAARRAIAALSQPVIKRTIKKRLASELMRRFGAGQSLFWGGAIVFDELMKASVMSSQERYQRQATYDVILKYQEAIAKACPTADYAARMSYLELKLRLPELLLMRVDKITMAASVEARVPFLDHHLIEYALGLPANLKVKGRSGKFILKQALEQLLPAKVLYSPKRGFGAPIREWFRGPTGQVLVDRLMNSSMRRRDFLDYSFISSLIDEHRRETHDRSTYLWCLLNLSLWYDRWIDRG